MKNTKFTVPHACLVVGLLLTTGLSLPAGDDKFDGQHRAALIAPWFDDQAFAVGHWNLSRFPGKDLSALLAKLPLPDQDQKLARAFVEKLGPGLVEAQVKSVYAIWTLDDPEQPVFVVPTGPGVDQRKVAKLLRGNIGHKVEERGDDYVVAGDVRILKRLKHTKRDVPELAKGFSAAGDTAVQMVVRPPVSLRRAFLEVMPNLPAELGGAPLTVLDSGVVWAALGFDVSPMQARLVIQSKDAASAKALDAALAKAWERFGKDKRLNELFPKIDKLLPRLRPKVDGDRLILALNEEMAMQVLTAVGEARVRGESAAAENLCLIANAMHNYFDAHKTLPPPTSLDAKGKPLLSWRVLLLPYLEQGNLHGQFKLNEPWDSPHNKMLIRKMPNVYKRPSQKNAGEGKTCYQVPRMPGAIFEGPKGIHIKEILDGTSMTLLVLATNDDHAVIWTKPDDWEFNPKDHLRGLVRPGEKRFYAAFADGTVHAVSAKISAETMRRLIHRDDKQVIPQDTFDP